MIPKELLPSDLANCAFIAGGYAACPALATDIDVWVYIQKESETLREARARILGWLESEMWPYEEEEANSRREGFDKDGYSISSVKVAVVRSPHWSHPVHIIVTNAQPAELLETFDISTHQVAIVFGNVVKGSKWTPVTQPPVMLRNTPTTPERMEKIRTRYGHSIPFYTLEAQS